MSTEVLAVGESSPSELVCQIQAEHAKVVAHTTGALEHACRAGDLLREARARHVREDGTWKEWVAQNLDGINYNTAGVYMRLAAYRSHLKGANSIKQAKLLLHGLPEVHSYGRADRYAEEVRKEAVRMKREGMSYQAVADAVGVSLTTVYQWVNPRRTRAARDKYERRQREKAIVKQELERRAARRAVRKAGAATAEAYSLAERMQDVLAQAQREQTDRDAREALSLAGEHYRKMRDEIVRALGVQ